MTAFSATAEFGTAECARGTYFRLSCDGVGYVAATQDVKSVTASAGAARAFSLVGMALLGASALLSAAATFGMSGKALALPINVPVAPAAITMTGQAAQISWPSPIAQFLIGAKPIVTAFVAPLSARAIVVNGQAAQAAWPVLNAGYALSGQTIANPSLIAAERTFVLTPGPAGLAQPAPGATFLTAGQTVVNPSLVAIERTFVFSGQLAGLAQPAPGAAFSTAGQTIANPSLIAVERTFSLVGCAAEMSTPTPPSTFALAGYAIADPALIGLAGAFVLTGSAGELAMPVGTANFWLAGKDFVTAQRAAMVPGGFALFGKPVFRSLGIGLNIPGEPATAEMGTAEFPRYRTFSVFAAPAEVVWTGNLAILPAPLERTGFTLAGNRAESAMPVLSRAFVVDGPILRLTTSMAVAPAAWALAGLPITLYALDGATAFTCTARDALLRASLERTTFAFAGLDVFDVKWLGAAGATFPWSVKPSITNITAALSRASFNLLGWSVVDVIGPKGAHTYLIEVQAHDGVAVRTFYLSTTGFTSQPSDTPPNQYYDPRIIDPGNFERALFDGTALRGRAKSGSGDIVIASGDPGNGAVLDAWYSYGWSQRDIRIKSIPAGEKSLAAASTLFVGKLDSISSTKPLDQLTLKIADRLGDLDQPLLSELFAGTTLSTGATAEGNADLKGKIKQQCWGNCSNVPLQAANPYDLIYLASRSAVSSITVYDGGSALINDGNSPDVATLRAAVITGGHYRTCFSAGLVRVGALPEKSLTADVVEGADMGLRSAGRIAHRMLLQYGVPSNAISVGSLSALDALNSSECGYFVDNDRSVISAVQDVLDSIGAWMIADRDGTLVFGRHGAPSTAPQSTFDLDVVAIGDSLDMVDNEPPAWRVLVEFAPVFSVQADGDLLGNVSAERRAYLLKDFRTTTAAAASIKVKHLSAREVTIRTYLVDPDAAAAEASRQLTLLSAERQRYNITMPLTDAWPSVPGNSITLRNKRLGLSGGKPFVVLKRVDQYQNDTVQFSLWG